jgi:hypothetical protein
MNKSEFITVLKQIQQHHIDNFKKELKSMVPDAIVREKNQSAYYTVSEIIKIAEKLD